MPSHASRRRQDDASSPTGPALGPVRHRRVAMVRAAALVALTCGPLALVTSWASPSPVSDAARGTARPAPTPSAQFDESPGGFAEVFLGMWLRGRPEGEQESAAQKAVQSMAPGIAMPEFGGRPPRVGQVHTVRSVAVRPGSWSVTVAAALESAVHYFRVPVVVHGGRGEGAQSFVVTAAPARVPGPSRAPAPASPYTTEVAAGSALSTTVSQFLSAYLGSAGGAERYLAPHVSIAPLGAPYTAVHVERVSATGGTGAVGASGQQVRVRVEVTARDAQGARWPLVYALRLATRDGRWEVRALESGLESSKNTSSGKGGA